LELVGGSVEVKFHRSKQRAMVSVERIVERIVHFLEHYCDVPLVDEAFHERVAGARSGEERLARLVAASGFPNDVAGFVQALVTKLEAVNAFEGHPVELGGVVLPYHLLLAVLEVLVPGTGYKIVKKVSQLEEWLNIKVPPDHRADLQQVIETYPVRLSFHAMRQMRLSRYVAYQYQPFVEELDPEGEIHTWVGHFFRGIIEQMYQNRVIFIMNMACPVYCRFCFRKHKECRNQKAPTKPHVKQAVAYIQLEPLIKEIVLTGGDPFMNRATLQYAIDELAKVPHVQTLRVASRAVSYFPEMFLREDSYWLNYLIRTSLRLRERGKRLEVATHFIHPDEVSVEALDVITHLARAGVPVYVQTPFVNGCNESGREMVSLFTTLRAAGAEIHYIFMPTSPIKGNRIYWSTIEQGLRAASYLRAHVSDRAMPHVTTATFIGKIDWNTSGWAVERHEDDPRYIWIRTPYSHDYFDPFAPIMQISDRVRQNTEGTLDARFMAEIGDEGLFAGPRGLTSSQEAFEYKLSKTAEVVEASLEDLQAACRADQRVPWPALGEVPCEGLTRQHRTRAELDCAAPDEAIEAACDYVRARPEITDVVLSRRDDVLTELTRTLEVIDRLAAIPHVVAIRLRSLKLVYNPGAFSRAVITRLAARNRLAVVRPTRIEVETQLLHSKELHPEHAKVVHSLRLHGITVYNNTPLLGYINDNELEMQKISYGCRQMGIEFCNVIVAGAPIQRDWNLEYPIELNSVIDIGTHVRRHGSGREVPRYLLRTALGEVDFAIVPRIFDCGPEGEVRVRMRGYDLAYFQAIDPRFAWPADVTLDDEGHPMVSVPGVSLQNQEFLFAPLGPEGG
jgi:lysine 2,3-aminomutase